MNPKFSLRNIPMSKILIFGVEVVVGVLLVSSLIMFSADLYIKQETSQKKEAIRAEKMKSSLDKDTQSFLEEMDQQKPLLQRQDVVTTQPVEIKVFSQTPTDLSLPMKGIDGQPCNLKTEAYADLANEMIHLLPTALVCGGNSLSVHGHIRDSLGRQIFGKVAGDLTRDSVAIHLDAGTRLGVWLFGQSD